ncbi:hypothetical protein Tco_0300711 [Tanacetum coccineum]
MPCDSALAGCDTGSEGFQEIVDFLNGSHMRYALTKNPTIYVSLIKKFCQTTTVRTVDNGEQEIIATVNGKECIVTEASVRRHLQLADVDGISALPTTKIFDQLSLMGYVLTDDKLTFQKGKFSPKLRFLIHTILHYLSPKKTSWEQFSSNIATAIICLATNRTFNFSKMIFDGMVKNLDSKYKFLMYPRFIQIFLYKHKRFLNPHNRKYIAPTLTPKLFSNMKRGFSGEHTPLFSSMLAIQAEDGEGSGHPSEPQPPSFTAQPTHEEPIPNVVSSSHQKTQTPRRALNKVTKLPQTSEPIPNVPDEAVYEEWDNKVERATTTTASLDAEKASGSINKTQSMAIPNVPLPHGISSPRCQEAMGVPLPRLAKILADAAEENVHTYTRIRRAVSTGSIGISTASRLFSTAKELVSTAGASMPFITAGMVQEVNISIPSPVVIKDKGKGKMEESEDEQSKRTKLQQEQDRLGHEAALKELFETTMKNVNTFVPMETEDRGRASELAAGSSQATIIDSTEVGSSKRGAEAELDHEGSKRQKTNETSGSVQEQPKEEEKEMSQEDLQQMIMIVPVEEVYVEAL